MSEPDRDSRVPQPEPNWRRLYAAVLIALVVEVVLFYLFTRSFA